LSVLRLPWLSRHLAAARSFCSFALRSRSAPVRDRLDTREPPARIRPVDLEILDVGLFDPGLEVGRSEAAGHTTEEPEGRDVALSPGACVARISQSKGLAELMSYGIPAELTQPGLWGR
jgi:hypothetical protein